MSNKKYMGVCYYTVIDDNYLRISNQTDNGQMRNHPHKYSD